jgi:hypothetical protein
MSTTVRLVLASTLLWAAACSDDGGGDTAPAAPSDLIAEALDGGAHLTWVDNSDNEAHFMIMRMEDGVDTDMQAIDTVPIDATEYQDASVTSGSTYMYVITAMTESGLAADSDQVEFTAP